MRKVNLGENDSWFRNTVSAMNGSKEYKEELINKYNLILDDMRLLDKVSKYVRYLRVEDKVDNIYVEKHEKWLFIIALILFSKNLKSIYDKYKIPQEMFISTISEVLRKMKAAQKLGKEIWDVNVTWLEELFKFNIIQAGRLQFCFAKVNEPVYLLQNEEGKVNIFLDGLKFDEKGDLVKCVDDKDLNSGNKSRFYESKDCYIGNIITLQGKILNEMIWLDKKKWKIKIDPNTSILEVHIPEEEKLETKLCLDSFNKIEEICRKIPYHYEGYICRSWLMGSSLIKYLEVDWNIFRFQQLFNLYPCYREEKEIWKRVFGLEIKPEKGFVPTSSLQKKILDGYEQGDIISGGAGIRLKR